MSKIKDLKTSKLHNAHTPGSMMDRNSLHLYDTGMVSSYPH